MNVTVPLWVRRLVTCLFGGFVLALMVGKQEGTINGDFGVAFRQAVAVPRILIFLGVGVILFALITFWPLAVPYLHRPGIVPLTAGLVAVVIAQTVMNWYDPLVATAKSAKFSAVSSAVSASSAVSSTTSAFFSWFAWMAAIGGLVLCGAAVVTKLRPVGYLAGVVGVAAAVLAYTSHSDVVSVGGGFDHSLGMYVDVIGFLLIASAGITAVHSHTDVADTRGFLLRVLNFRPGLPIAVVGLIAGLFAFISDCWFAPQQRNLTFSGTHDAFSGTGLSSLGSQYLSWLGWTLFAASAVLALLTTALAHRILGFVTVLVSVAGIALTFFTLRTMTNTAATEAPQFGKAWANLGVGGFVACIVFALFAASTLQVLLAGGRSRTRTDKEWTAGMPVTAMIDNVRTSPRAATFIVIALALALFYPPMLPVVWQTVLVTQIGVFVLLAVGLNVVVGWAGLLDLGYIAFYAIGSYTTAFLVGSLPRKPPSWLHMSPLLTIPFAIAACLIAGLLLGAPTLRLRGDYLAIVTLGFGEIVTVVATNDPGHLTGGPQGPTVPHPVLKIGGLHITWGQDNLPYWYLLLVMLVVVVVLFYRLEGSRLGRAWAAIREDEVAAQATGVNTMRAKLLAFAIGASTSGLAGVFFATQVGYFDPTLYTLQDSILIVAYVVFGGMGSLPGAMAGAAALTWLPQFLKDQVPQTDRQMWIGAAVLAMMIFRPAGLLPARRRKAELEGLETASSAEVMAVPASEGL
jgi:ABC-type branched-subunit amino acid transport system permease subunit